MCLVDSIAFAQSDTLILEPIQVVESFLASSDAGIQADVLDKEIVSQYAGNSFSELLQENTGLYIRKYGGEGQLSSVSFRGTTPNHTIVSWQGIDINSQTLGQSDMSSIPSFVFESAEIYAGGRSTLFGGGNIGGSISLKNAKPKDGISVGLYQEFGSFGRFMTGMKLAQGKDKFSYMLAGYRNTFQNDFKVNYRRTVYNQNNADSQLQGVKATIYYNLNSSQKLEMDLWYNQHNRSLQPIIGDLTNEDHLLDNNIRVNLSHRWSFASSLLKSSYAHVRDYQTYNYSSETNLTRDIVDFSYDYYSEGIWNISIGSKTQVARTAVESYDGDTSQWKTDNFILISLVPLSKVNMSAKIQKSWIEGVNVPFLIGGGIDYEMLKNSETALTLGLNLSESFRAPTLNDLLWSPGGNPDLTPENGFHSEVHYNLVLRKSEHELKLKSNFYQTKISDMIQWLPQFDDNSNQTVWSPQNVQKVRIRGFESSVTYTNHKRNKHYISSIYTYNDSRNLFPVGGNENTIDKQLAYVPFHKFIAKGSTSIHNWSFVLGFQYTGKRYTEASNTLYVEGFGILNATIKKEISFLKSQLLIAFEIDNLTNKDYQNYELRATPGRGYTIKINYNFSNTNLK
ncbi:MAG: vitamin B12 transporter [Cyclobacteriaceae bacterium]|jgi:vitamin B12 transporter